MKFYCNTAMPIHLGTDYNCFHATVMELSIMTVGDE